MAMYFHTSSSDFALPGPTILVECGPMSNGGGWYHMYEILRIRFLSLILCYVHELMPKVHLDRREKTDKLEAHNVARE